MKAAASLLLLILLQSAVSADTGYLDPDGDDAVAWETSTGANHYTEIDDGVRQPDTPNGTDLIEELGVDVTVDDDFTMTSIEGVVEVSSVEIWVRSIKLGGTEITLSVDLYIGGSWQGLQEVEMGGWNSITFNGSWNQEDLDALKVRIRKSNTGGVDVHAMYAEVTYTSSGPTPRLIEDGVGLGYRVDAGVRRNSIQEGGGYTLTYNVRPGVYPHVYEESPHRLDLMVVNKPPNITDTEAIFNYSYVKSEVAWAALTLNLSAANATVLFERTIDFTDTENLNLDRDVNLSFNYVLLNTTSMTAINKTAKITLENLSFTAVQIQKDGSSCTDCTVLSYEDGVAVFRAEPAITSYWAAELAGWVEWNVIDMINLWVGSSDDNKGVIVVGEEDEDSLRQYYGSNATDSSLTPKLEVNYTLPHQSMYNNETQTDVFDLDDYFYDLDRDTLSFQTSSDHPNILITIDDNDHTVDIKPLNNWHGTQYVVFTASDGRGGTTTSNNVTLYVVQGETTTTTTSTTTNAEPRVGAVEGDGPGGNTIVLVAGGLKHVSFNASVSDADGCDEIETMQLIFWDNDSTTHESEENEHNLYKNDSCSIECSGDDGTVRCGLHLEYYANHSTAWIANISVSDGYDWAHNVTYDITVESLAAVNVSSTIDFSTIAGGTSLDLGFTPAETQEVDFTVRNVGNVRQDLLVSGSDLACSIGGAIPVGNVKYDTNANTAYASMCGSVTANSQDTCSELKDDFNLPKTDGTTPSEKSIYWSISIPSSGVGGTCTGTLTIGGQES